MKQSMHAKSRPTLEDAVALAAKAHRGQIDKSGQPYFLHPLRVMLRLEGETARMAGVLHDVVEDTAVTLDDLRAAGYSEDVCAAVESVTRRSDETYEEFVARAGRHPVGRLVKLADLEDNMDMRRISHPTSRDWARLERYRAARAALEQGSAG
jgi:(p)ppGpp synthase/HD superfamily hydrolase